MFDVGFSEILLTGIVALVVLGPERLPKVARTAGVMMGRLQRYVAGVKADINRELSDLEQMKELKDLKKEVEQAGSEIESSMRQNMVEAENQVKQITDEVGANMASSTRSFEEVARSNLTGPTPAVDSISPPPLEQAATTAPQAEPAPPDQLELALDEAQPPRAAAPQA